jgi:hypothetical protein
MEKHPWGSPSRRDPDRGARALKRRFERVTGGIEKQVRWNRRRRLAILAVAMVIGFTAPFAIKPAIGGACAAVAELGQYLVRGVGRSTNAGAVGSGGPELVQDGTAKVVMLQAPCTVASSGHQPKAAGGDFLFRASFGCGWRLVHAAMSASQRSGH